MAAVLRQSGECPARATTRKESACGPIGRERKSSVAARARGTWKGCGTRTQGDPRGRVVYKYTAHLATSYQSPASRSDHWLGW